MWEVLQLPGVIQIDPTGSRVICDPAPVDTDLDIICLVEASYKLQGKLEKLGFDHTSLDDVEEYTEMDSDIDCYRFGEINLILIDNKEFYTNFLLATTLCKSMNVLDKEKRIEIFQAILYGSFSEGE